MKKLTVYILGIALLAVFSPSVYGEEKGQNGAKAIFEQKCSICHSIERPKSKKKTAKEWESTVMRMKDVNGCPITDEEAKSIIDYLSKNYNK